MENKKCKKHDDNDTKIWIRVPYIGEYTDRIVKQSIQKLKKCMKTPHVKFCVTYDTNKIEMFTNTKDMTSLLPKSSVVYRFKCIGCHMEYVGKADRNLEERIIEHATKSNQPSAVYNHIYSCDHFQYLYKIMSFPKFFQDNI